MVFLRATSCLTQSPIRLDQVILVIHCFEQYVLGRGGLCCCLKGAAKLAVVIGEGRRGE